MMALRSDTMKRNVLIICVNYNSYIETNNYLGSINNSLSDTNDINVDVIVADNSDLKSKLVINTCNLISVKHIFLDNLGYLPAAANVINLISNIKEYDYIIISNVDVKVDPQFFQHLKNLTVSEDVGWIAPQIWTESESRDKNPKVLERYSKSKLEKIKLLYKYPLLDYIYTNTLYFKKKSRPQYGEMDIYAGHGSFMILTKRFFDFYREINYPIFLFGEELFLAELNRKAGLRVRYIPDLKIIDNEHVSTSKMKKKSYYKYNLDSINYILDTFYE